MLAELQFLRPFWFLALLPLAVLLVLFWRRQTGGQGWRGLVDPHLLPHLLVGGEGAPRRFPLALLGVGWILGVTALAGPVWERLPQPVFSTSAQRVILLDLSPSMNATDIRPSRLARARFELLDILRATDEGQVALIAFGPEPFLVSPLTADAQTIADQVPRLASDLIPVPGPRRTDRALEMAGALLDQAGVAGGEVILLTDGVGTDGAIGSDGDSLASAAARKLAASGVRVSVLAVGTRDGAPVPAQDGSFVDDRSGAIHMARLDEQGLRAVARAGGGDYVPLAAGELDTLALIDSGALGTDGAVEQEGVMADQWREEGPWLLLALLPIAALGFRRGWLLPVLVLVVFAPQQPLMAQEQTSASPQGAGWQSDLARAWDGLWKRPDQRAAQAFNAGDHGAAADGFEDPAWRAAAHYRAGDHVGALDDLASLQGPESDYNRGNALARLGRLDEAIAAYERTLEQVPDHDDAQANLDLVRQLKERQEQESRDAQESGESGDSESGANDQQGQSQEGGQSEGSDQSQGADDQAQTGQDGASEQGRESGQSQGGESESESSGSEQEQGQVKDQAQSQGAESGNDSEMGQGSADSSQSGGQEGQATPQGPGREPQAEDLGERALGGEPQADLDDGKSDSDGPKPDSNPQLEPEQTQGEETADRGEPGATVAAEETLTPQQREQAQAMEAQLRRVPDDPAGLLRQRFLLQHLRREGRLQ